MIKGLFIILFFYAIGEVVSYLIHGFIPGSVLGMIFLFTALFFNWLNPNHVRDTATLITKNMALFFVPAGVGLMTYYNLLSSSWVAILAIIVISNLLVIASVALIQERLEKKANKKT